MSGGHSSSGIGNAVKKGVGMVHGTGEAIRGNFNAAVDQASGDRAGIDKNTAIAANGANEIDHGYHRTGHGAGVTPADADRERLNTTHTTSTNYGSHSTNTANKLDPRFDSDMDHRGTATGSTNVGHHSNNVANKLDPRIDSDADHRANPNSCCNPTLYSQTDGTDSTTTLFGSKWEPSNTASHDHEHGEHCNCHAQHIHRGSICDGTNLEAAQKLDPVLGTDGGQTTSGPNSNNFAHNPDPRVDPDGTEHSSTNNKPYSTIAGNRSDSLTNSDLDHRDAVYNKVGRAATFARRGTEPSTYASQTYNDEPRAARKSGSEDELRRGSLPQDATAPLHEPRSTDNPHKSDFLKLLDLRVNRNGVKQEQSSGS